MTETDINPIDQIDRLENFLKTEFYNCFLMPCRENKCPLYKHAGIEVDKMWMMWESWRDTIQHGVLIILREDLIVVDIDDMNYVEAFEQQYPFLLDTAIQKTKKGRHYFFIRTPLCDEMNLFDGARQFTKNGEILPVDIKTKCATGTGGCIAVCPSPDKKWITPLYNFTRETLPHIPDEFVKVLYNMKTHNKLYHGNSGTRKDMVTTEVTMYKMNPPKFMHTDPDLWQKMKTTVDLQDISSLINCLSEERAQNYTSWIEVMWVLQNILLEHKLTDSKNKSSESIKKENETYAHIAFENDPQNFIKKMFIIFDKFSRKCLLKYSMSECLQKWCAPHNQGLGIGTLHMWAKNDFPDDYYFTRMWSLSRMVNTTNIQHRKLGERFANYICTNFIHVGNNKWCHFSGSSWKEDVELATIKNIMHNNFVGDLEKLIKYDKKGISDLNEKLTKCANQDKTKKIQEQIIELIEKIKKIDKIIYKLGDRSFAEKMIREVGDFLRDNTFMDKLDVNPQLIAFKNGVWDLLEARFRPTTPFDMVSKSVGYDYVEEKNEEVAQKVDQYLRTMHPNPQQCSYIVRMFARNLFGDNAESVFHLHAGVKASAANGKSTFFEILEAALGDYICKFPVEFILGSRGEDSKPRPEYENWRGSRIIYCNEPSKEDKINSGILKEFTGGDKITY